MAGPSSAQGDWTGGPPVHNSDFRFEEQQWRSIIGVHPVGRVERAIGIKKYNVYFGSPTVGPLLMEFGIDTVDNVLVIYQVHNSAYTKGGETGTINRRDVDQCVGGNRLPALLRAAVEHAKGDPAALRFVILRLPDDGREWQAAADAGLELVSEKGDGHLDLDAKDKAWVAQLENNAFLRNVINSIATFRNGKLISQGIIFRMKPKRGKSSIRLQLEYKKERRRSSPGGEGSATKRADGHLRKRPKIDSGGFQSAPRGRLRVASSELYGGLPIKKRRTGDSASRGNGSAEGNFGSGGPSGALQDASSGPILAYDDQAEYGTPSPIPPVSFQMYTYDAFVLNLLSKAGDILASRQVCRFRKDDRDYPSPHIYSLKKIRKWAARHIGVTDPKSIKFWFIQPSAIIKDQDDLGFWLGATKTQPDKVELGDRGALCSGVRASVNLEELVEEQAEDDKRKEEEEKERKRIEKEMLEGAEEEMEEEEEIEGMDEMREIGDEWRENWKTMEATLRRLKGMKELREMVEEMGKTLRESQWAAQEEGRVDEGKGQSTTKDDMPNQAGDKAGHKAGDKATDCDDGEEVDIGAEQSPLEEHEPDQAGDEGTYSNNEEEVDIGAEQSPLEEPEPDQAGDEVTDSNDGEEERVDKGKEPLTTDESQTGGKVTDSNDGEDDEYIEDNEDIEGGKLDIILGDRLPSQTQFSDELWQECCAALGHDPAKVSPESRDLCYLKGTTLALKPYQLLCVWWMLSQPERRKLYGGVVADDMGLGKTFEGMGFLAIRSMLLSCLDDMEENPDDHLPPSPEGRTEQEDGVVCKKDFQFGVQCCCQERGATFRVARQLWGGPALIVAPVEMFYEWKQRLIGSLVGEPSDGKFTLRCIASSSHVSVDEYFTTAISDAMMSPLKEKPKKATSGKEKVLVYDVAPVAGEHKNIILVTSTMIKDVRLWSSKYSKNIKVFKPGAILLDEFHKYRGHKTGKDKKRAQVMELLHNVCDGGMQPQHRKKRDDTRVRPLIFGMSGTPCERSPADLYTLLEVIIPYNNKRHAMLDELEGLARTYNKLVNPGSARNKRLQWDEEARDFKTTYSLFTSNIVIRRSRTTTFCGYLVSRLGNVNPLYEERHFLHDEYKDDIFKYQRQFLRISTYMFNKAMDEYSKNGGKGPYPTRCDTRAKLLNNKGPPVSRLLRIFCSFPALARWHKKGGDLDFTRDGVERALDTVVRDPNGFKETAYYRKIDEIVDGSWKRERLEEILNEMINDRTPHALHPQTTLRNMVIFCSIPANLLVLYAQLTKCFSGRVDLDMIPSALPGNKREPLIAEFNRWDNKKPRVILTSVKVLGTGINLTRANYCIIFDIPYMEYEISQALARVSRDPQVEPLFLHAFVGLGCEGERRIRDRQKKRDDLGAKDASAETTRSVVYQ